MLQAPNRSSASGNDEDLPPSLSASRMTFFGCQPLVAQFRFTMEDVTSCSHVIRAPQTKTRTSLLSEIVSPSRFTVSRVRLKTNARPDRSALRFWILLSIS